MSWLTFFSLWPWANILNLWVTVCNLERYWQSLEAPFYGVVVAMEYCLSKCFEHGEVQAIVLVHLVSQPCWNIFTHCRSRHLIIHSTFTEQTLIEFQKLWLMLTLNREPLSLTLESKERKRTEDWRAGSSDELPGHVLTLAWNSSWHFASLWKM